jgi:hypothetical protein
MSDEDSLKLEKFNERINEILEELGISEVYIDEKEIKKFCDLIQDDNLLYHSKLAAQERGYGDKLVPPGYMMNLTNPVTQEIFIKGGPDFFPGLIKGVIHVGSVVSYYKPMLVNNKYYIKIEITNPVILKRGSKGDYYSIIFGLSILDEDESVYAVDNHEFFFKLN